MKDRKGNPLNPGDRVHYQVHPNRPWVPGTVTSDGRHVRGDYNGARACLWPCSVQLAETERVAA